MAFLSWWSDLSGKFVNERDLSMLNSVKDDSDLITFQKDFVCLTQESLRQQQVCDALRCSGLHAPYTDAFNEFLRDLERLGNLQCAS